MESKDKINISMLWTFQNGNALMFRSNSDYKQKVELLKEVIFQAFILSFYYSEVYVF